MAKVAARKASLFLESSGVWVGISSYVSSATLTFSSEATDLTGFGNDNRERASDGIRDWEFSMDGFWANGATETDGILSGIKANGGATMFKFGPCGSAGTCPMYTASALLTTYESNFSAADSAKISFTLAARTGSLTRTQSGSW